MLQVVDDALHSVSQSRTTEDTDAKVKEATDVLSAYERKYHFTDFRETVTQTMAKADAKDKSSKFLKRVNEIMRVRRYVDLCFAAY